MDGNPSSPGLWRLAAAARMTGLSPDAFAGACRLGQIPVEIVEIGPRAFRFVKADQLTTWLKDQTCKST
jgi:hypothetical protein